MSSSIDTCFENLDKVQQVERLDNPCRTVVIVYSAWGLIENGGFHFSKLVSSFPFNEPHKFPGRRQEFIDSQPSSFIALMAALEDRVFTHENIEKTLDSFLRIADAS